MEAVWRIEVEDFPAFVVVDDKGNDFFEAVTKLVNTAGLLVPGRIGVSEGGSALLAGALGFAASHGLSLALMRRVRATIWAIVGIALLPFQEARARRRQCERGAS